MKEFSPFEAKSFLEEWITFEECFFQGGKQEFMLFLFVKLSDTKCGD